MVEKTIPFPIKDLPVPRTIKPGYCVLKDHFVLPAHALKATKSPSQISTTIIDPLTSA